MADDVSEERGEGAGRSSGPNGAEQVIEGTADSASCAGVPVPSHLLVEITSLDELSFPTQSSRRIRYTSLCASSRLLVVGCSTGSVFVFSRFAAKGRQRMAPVPVHVIATKDGPVAQVCISVCEKLLAVGGESGRVSVAGLTSNGGGGGGGQAGTHAPQVVYTVPGDARRPDRVTCMCWTDDGQLLVGHASGAVNMHRVTQARNVFSRSGVEQLRAPQTQAGIPASPGSSTGDSVVQLSVCGRRVLVSSLATSHLLPLDGSQAVQVGRKPRNGRMGACFLRGEEGGEGEGAAEAAVVLAARPNGRVWEANQAGVVYKTHQFRECLSVPHLDPVSYRLPFPVESKEATVSFRRSSSSSTTSSSAYISAQSVGSPLLASRRYVTPATSMSRQNLSLAAAAGVSGCSEAERVDRSKQAIQFQQLHVIRIDRRAFLVSIASRHMVVADVDNSRIVLLATLDKDVDDWCVVGSDVFLLSSDATLRKLTLMSRHKACEKLAAKGAVEQAARLAVYARGEGVGRSVLEAVVEGLQERKDLEHLRGNVRDLLHDRSTSSSAEQGGLQHERLSSGVVRVACDRVAVSGLDDDFSFRPPTVQAKDSCVPWRGREARMRVGVGMGGGEEGMRERSRSSPCDDRSPSAEPEDERWLRARRMLDSPSLAIPESDSLRTLLGLGLHGGPAMTHSLDFKETVTMHNVVSSLEELAKLAPPRRSASSGSAPSTRSAPAGGSEFSADAPPPVPPHRRPESERGSSSGGGGGGGGGAVTHKPPTPSGPSPLSSPVPSRRSGIPMSPTAARRSMRSPAATTNLPSPQSPLAARRPIGVIGGVPRTPPSPAPIGHAHSAGQSSHSGQTPSPAASPMMPRRLETGVGSLTVSPVPVQRRSMQQHVVGTRRGPTIIKPIRPGVKSARSPVARVAVETSNGIGERGVPARERREEEKAPPAPPPPPTHCTGCGLHRQWLAVLVAAAGTRRVGIRGGHWEQGGLPSGETEWTRMWSEWARMRKSGVSCEKKRLCPACERGWSIAEEIVACAQSSIRPVVREPRIGWQRARERLEGWEGWQLVFEEGPLDTKDGKRQTRWKCGEEEASEPPTPTGDRLAEAAGGVEVEEENGNSPEEEKPVDPATLSLPSSSSSSSSSSPVSETDPPDQLIATRFAWLGSVTALQLVVVCSISLGSASLLGVLRRESWLRSALDDDAWRALAAMRACEKAATLGKEVPLRMLQSMLDDLGVSSFVTVSEASVAVGGGHVASPRLVRPGGAAAGATTGQIACDLNGPCPLCSLPLKTQMGDNRDGLTAYACGHAYHSVCLSSRSLGGGVCVACRVRARKRMSVRGGGGSPAAPR